MKTKLCKTLPLLLCLLLCLSLSPAVFAADATAAPSFQDLKDACQNGPGNYYFENLGPFTIEESIRIPQGMSVYAEGTQFIIPAGVTLEVDGSLRASGMQINENGIVRNNNYIRIPDSLSIFGTLELNSTFHMRSGVWNSLTDEMRECIQFNNSNACLEVHDDVYNWNDLLRLSVIGGQNYNPRINWIIELRNMVTLEGSLHIAKGVHLTSWAGLEIPAGMSMIVDGSYEARNVPLTVKGGLTNNTWIRFLNSSFNVVEGSSYGGSGEIQIRDVTDPEYAASRISGLDLSDFQVFRNSNLVSFIPWQHFVDGPSFAEAYQRSLSGNRAVLDPANYYLDSDFVIPAGVAVEARNCGIHIPAGVSLKIQGQLFTSGINTLNGGSLILDGGFLSVNDGRNGFQGKGTWELTNAQMDASAGLWPLFKNNPNITYNGDSLITFHFDVTDPAYARSAFDASTDVTGEHVRPCVELPAYTLTDDLVIPDNLLVNLHGGFTVSDTATLTLNGQMHAYSGMRLNVDGTLINNGTVEIARRDGSEPMLTVNGRYRGLGSIAVTDIAAPESYISGLNLDFFSAKPTDSGVIYTLHPTADFVLPASLTEIGEEAFDGNAFVYAVIPEGTKAIGPRAFASCKNLAFIMIPASVESIDSTAFSGVPDLTVFGPVGSYAQSFAESAENLYFQSLPLS